MCLVARYMKSARAEGPYLPSNMDFIAANNGLPGKEAVQKTVFDASYMVLGLGGEQTSLASIPL